MDSPRGPQAPLTTPTPPVPRFLALDWETNGFRADPDQPLPCANWPVSVSLWAVAVDGSVEHLYSSKVSGATQFSTWAAEHHPFTPEDLRTAPAFEEVIRAMIAMVREGDVLVCHNMDYDVGKVLVPMCRRLGLEADGMRLLRLPWVCTCKGGWASTLLGGKWLSMRELCTCFGVRNGDEHSASGDAKALAECLAVALTRREEHVPGHGLARELLAAGERAVAR